MPNPPLIIGLTGRAGAGKTTAANILVELGFCRGKFAHALKDMLREYLRYRGVDEIKIERMIEGDLKEVSSPYFGGKTPRFAMQTLGTEWGRDIIDEDLWTDTEIEAQRRTSLVVYEDVRFASEGAKLRAAGAVIFEIHNPRQPARRRGILAWLLRWAAWVKEHSSESMPVRPDRVIVNGGTIDDLREALHGALAELRAA